MLAADPTTLLDAKLHSDVRTGFPCIVRGTVTTRVNPTEFYLQDESSGVRVASEPFVLRPGQQLEVEGWMYLADSSEFRITAKRVSDLGNKPPPTPPSIALPAASAGGYQGQLIAVRGSVLNIDFGEEFDTISIQSGRSSLRIFYAANRHGVSVFERIFPGMEVAVTGISVPQTAPPEHDGYQIRLRSPADLTIRQAATAPRQP